MADTYPTVRLAAAQVASVLLDREATIRKAVDFIRDAAAHGADLVAFPEGFVPAHPLWFTFHAATSGTASRMSRELFDNAVMVPGPDTDKLCAAAQAGGCYVVIGICEKEPASMGTMYNSQLVIGRDGSILGVRRKITPTIAERIVHSAGAGDSVRVFPTEFGAVSGLLCGENSNPLLTYTMQALGARVHVASWPNFFSSQVDMQAIADVAGRAIAYQNSCFVVNVLGAIGPEMVDRLPASKSDRTDMVEMAKKGGTAIYAPGGKVLAGPMAAGEGILYADADIGAIVPRKIVHDYTGDYNRFDIFQLAVNVAPAAPPIRIGGTTDESRTATSWPVVDEQAAERQAQLGGGGVVRSLARGRSRDASAQAMEDESGRAADTAEGVSHPPTSSHVDK